MVNYNVNHTESSENDLVDILRYIAIELKETSTALRMVDIINKSIESLYIMPHRCALVDDERLAAMG